MIEAGQANPAQNHAGTCAGSAGGHGVMIAANAVSIGNDGVIITPHGRGMARTGTIDGAKKSNAPINWVLTNLRIFLRSFIAAPAPTTGMDITPLGDVTVYSVQVARPAFGQKCDEPGRSVEKCDYSEGCCGFITSRTVAWHALPPRDLYYPITQVGNSQCRCSSSSRQFITCITTTGR